VLLLLLFVVLGILLFGGLGVFVAKVFFIGIAVVLLLSFLGGTSLRRR
jgi:hypothetical protein